MIRLSVNVNKVATLRNSRGGHEPSVLAAVQTCLDAGAKGITIHPRADERHIRRSDIFEVAEKLAPYRDRVEFNIEGDPRPELLDAVCEVRPHQCTLVPVRPGEITSQAGWDRSTDRELLRGVVRRLQDHDVRVSLFVDPTHEGIELAADVGADRVELFTEPFAAAFARGLDQGRLSFNTYVAAAELARRHDLGINAGHDLNLDNLSLFRTLPYLDEVSIGHALIGHALFVGLRQAVHDYLVALTPVGAAPRAS
ncbi:MAG: pyridoxine 5'-phosphate synthase [Nannocystaceae bacterium]